MQSNSDFSPITEQGELELEAGLFSRLKRRRDIAPVSPGFARILLDAESTPIDELTAGQKYWSRARGWVKVDVRNHSLEYQIAFPDPTGLAGFVVSVDVSVCVSNPRAAVLAGAESVEEYLRPALQSEVRRAYGEETALDDSQGPVNVLNQLRLAATKNLERLNGEVKGVPEWLSAKVTSVAVELDEATEKHRAELIERRRAVALADADGESDLAKAKNQLKVQQLWEEGFADRLGDPERRALAKIAADPTRENIDRVAGELDQIEAKGRAAMVEVFRVALEKGYFAEDEAILNVMGAMQHGGQLDGALEEGEKPRQVEPPENDENVIEVETVEAETAEEDLDPEDKKADEDEDERPDADWGAK